MCLYAADTIVILVLMFLCRKLLQLPGLMIGSGAYVGHSAIFKKLCSSKSCIIPGTVNSYFALAQSQSAHHLICDYFHSSVLP